MYYILRISNKAFVKVEDNGDLTITQEPVRATKFDKLGDAMKEAAQINEDWEGNVVEFIKVG